MDFSNPIIVSLMLSMAIQAFFFAFAYGFKTDKVTDLSYGLTFVALAWYWYLSGDQSLGGVRAVVTGMVTLWAVRLSTYLLIRILRTKRDNRFDDKRDSFIKFGKFWLLQGIAVWVIMLPVVYVLTRSQVLTSNGILLLGAYIWALGLVVEALADFQLYNFRFKKEKADKTHPWIDEGLWHYSRHPNYFGEITLWWGVFIFGMSTYSGIGWLVVAGPLFITGLLLFASGIPILERANDRRWGSDKAYQDYKASTSILVPLPKRSVPARKHLS